MQCHHSSLGNFCIQDDVRHTFNRGTYLGQVEVSVPQMVPVEVPDQVCHVTIYPLLLVHGDENVS